MQTLAKPSLLRHFAALLYDTVLVLPIIMLCVGLATVLQLAVAGQPVADDFSAVLHPQLVQLFAVLTVCVFYSYFWCRTGQTLGMQAWRIKLRTTDHSQLGIKHALLRCGGAVLSLAALGAGFWWRFIDRNDRYWHDSWSNTELELLPKPEKD